MCLTCPGLWARGRGSRCHEGSGADTGPCSLLLGHPLGVLSEPTPAGVGSPPQATANTERRDGVCRPERRDARAGARQHQWVRAGRCLPGQRSLRFRLLTLPARRGGCVQAPWRPPPAPGSRRRVIARRQEAREGPPPSPRRVGERAAGGAAATRRRLSPRLPAALLLPRSESFSIKNLEECRCAACMGASLSPAERGCRQRHRARPALLASSSASPHPTNPPAANCRAASSSWTTPARWRWPTAPTARSSSVRRLTHGAAVAGAGGSARAAWHAAGRPACPAPHPHAPALHPHASLPAQALWTAPPCSPAAPTARWRWRRTPSKRSPAPTASLVRGAGGGVVCSMGLEGYCKVEDFKEGRGGVPPGRCSARRCMRCGGRRTLLRALRPCRPAPSSARPTQACSPPRSPRSRAAPASASRAGAAPTHS